MSGRANLVWVVRTRSTPAERFLIEGERSGSLAEARRFDNELDAETVISILEHPEECGSLPAYVDVTDTLHPLEQLAAFQVLDLNQWGFSVELTWAVDATSDVNAVAKDAEGNSVSSATGSVDHAIADIHGRLQPSG